MRKIEFILIRQALVLIASLIGSYTDYKTGLINDWITIPLIIIGVLLNLVFFDLNALLLGAIVFGTGYLTYYFGKLGGGDVKLFTGIALMLPFFEGKIFILNTIFYAGITSAIFYGIYYSIKYFQKGIDFELIKKKIPTTIFLILIFLIYFLFIIQTKIISIELTLIVFLFIAIGLIFFILEEGIKQSFFLTKIKISELEEDEVITEDEKIKKILGLKFKGIIGEKEKQKLIKEGIREVKVYRNLPKFGPFIFIGTILAMILPPITMLGVI